MNLKAFIVGKERREAVDDVDGMSRYVSYKHLYVRSHGM